MAPVVEPPVVNPPPEDDPPPLEVVEPADPWPITDTDRQPAQARSAVAIKPRVASSPIHRRA